MFTWSKTLCVCKAPPDATLSFAMSVSPSVSLQEINLLPQKDFRKNSLGIFAKICPHVWFRLEKLRHFSRRPRYTYVNVLSFMWKEPEMRYSQTGHRNAWQCRHNVVSHRYQVIRAKFRMPLNVTSHVTTNCDNRRSSTQKLAESCPDLQK
jgi:hypothetical protein